jgi:hypothetical protein
MDPELKKYMKTETSATVPRLSIFCKSENLLDYRFSEQSTPLLCFDPDTKLSFENRLFTHVNLFFFCFVRLKVDSIQSNENVLLVN